MVDQQEWNKTVRVQLEGEGISDEESNISEEMEESDISTSDELMDGDLYENNAQMWDVTPDVSSDEGDEKVEYGPEWPPLIPFHSCEFEWFCKQRANWDMLQFHLDPHGTFTNHGIRKICLYHRFCGRCNRDLEKCHPSLGINVNVTFQPADENSSQYCIDCFKFWNEYRNPNRDDITGSEQEKINQFLDRWFAV